MILCNVLMLGPCQHISIYSIICRTLSTCVKCSTCVCDAELPWVNMGHLKGICLLAFFFKSRSQILCCWSWLLAKIYLSICWQAQQCDTCIQKLFADCPLLPVMHALFGSAAMFCKNTKYCSYEWKCRKTLVKKSGLTHGYIYLFKPVALRILLVAVMNSFFHNPVKSNVILLVFKGQLVKSHLLQSLSNLLNTACWEWEETFTYFTFSFMVARQNMAAGNHSWFTMKTQLVTSEVKIQHLVGKRRYCLP